MAELFKKSRQQEWQERKRAAGLCIICGQPVVTKLHCQKHRLAQNDTQRSKQRARTGSSPWHPAEEDVLH